MFTSASQRRIEDAKKFHESDDDLCMLCYAYGADKRSLWIDCFYDVAEVVPEALSIGGAGLTGKHQGGFYLRICKSCRGRLLTHLGTWRKECIALRSLPKNHDGRVEDDSEDRNIFVRINGAVIAMNEDEYQEYSAGQDLSAQRTS